MIFIEVAAEVKIYEIKMKCDKCKKGEMIFQKEVKSSKEYNLEYLHKCNKCGYEEYYKITYPTNRKITIE